MSQSSPSFLKAYAKRTVYEFWKEDILRDFKDDIEYIDGNKHGKSRPNFDRKNFLDQIDFYAEQFVDEWLLLIKKDGVTTREEFRDKYENVDKIHHKLMIKYRLRMDQYVKNKRTD